MSCLTRAPALFAILFTASVLLGGGCAKSKGVHPSPETAAAACRTAVNDATRFGPNGRIRRSLSGCKELFSLRDCREAIQEYADLQGPTLFDRMLSRCGSAYCPVLPEPRPELCAKEASATPQSWAGFTEGVMRYELGSDVFERNRLAKVLLTPGTEIIKELLDTPPARATLPAVEIRAANDLNTVTLFQADGGAQVWTVTRAVEPKELAPIRQAIAEEGSPTIHIRSEKLVLFRVLRALMGSAVDAGSEDIVFTVIPDSPDAGR